jgi:hypothetical protein
MLAPLAKLTSKDVKWQWGTTEQLAFDDVKKPIVQEVFLTFNKSFETGTDASKFQLGAATTQGGKPIAFCSGKLNKAQRDHTDIYWARAFSYRRTLKEFRTIMFGQKLVVCTTEHEKLTFSVFNMEHVMRWQVTLEEH